MPTGHDPTPTRLDQVLVIELNDDNRGTPTSGSAEDEGAIFIPIKVLVPDLAAWIKEGHSLPAFGVGAMRSRAFVTVAQWTSQPEIVLRGRAAGREGNDVFYVHRHGRKLLLSQAVAAAVTGLSGNFFS